MQRLVFYLVLPPILILSVATVTVLAGMRLAYQGDYPDPFVAYEAMMPGQWVMATGGLPCESDSIPGNFEMISCDLHPVDGHFVSVSSSSYNGSFVETWFNANNLLVGDVVRHWGRPDIVVRLNHRLFYLFWADQELVGFIRPVGVAGRFSYMQQVKHFSISLESRNLPSTPYSTYGTVSFLVSIIASESASVAGWLIRSLPIPHKKMNKCSNICST